MESDIQVLKRWWKRRDAEAFNEIVTRYSGLVYGACLRVLGNPSDAEDVAQECFLRLAEHPVAIQSSLGGWLHRMATRRALDAYRSRVRRLSRDTRFAESTPEAASPDDLTWHEIRGLVDEAIDALPEEQRAVIIAHFIERRTQQAIAEELGVARRTVINRIQKGIELIRATLSKRGVVVGEMALLALFGSRFVEAAPVSLLSALGRLALAGTAGKTTTAASVAGVAGGIVVMKKTIVGAAVLASVLLAGLYFASGTRTGPQHAEDTGPAPTASAQEVRQRATVDTAELAGAMETALGAAQSDREAIDAASEGAVVEGVVLNQQGRPVADASIHIADNPTQDNVLNKPPVTHTDSGGQFRITHVNPKVHMVFADHPAYAPGWTGIKPEADTTAHVEILLTRGGAIEGVVTSGGVPQADAFVSAWLDASGQTDQTDAEGRYTLPRVPSGEWVVNLILKDEDGVQREVRSSVLVEDDTITSLDFHLQPAVTDLSGTVRLRGKPVPGGYVTLLIGSEQGFREQRRKSLDNNGTYTIERVPAGPSELSVTAIQKGHSPYFRHRSFEIQPGASSVYDVDIHPGAGVISGSVQVEEPRENGAILLLDGEFSPAELSRSTLLYIDFEKAGISQKPMEPYRFDELEPGMYTLLALIYSDETTMSNTVDPLATALIDIQTIKLEDGAELEVDLVPAAVR